MEIGSIVVNIEIGSIVVNALLPVHIHYIFLGVRGGDGEQRLKSNVFVNHCK